MIGDGPDRSKCENLARKLGVYKKIKFLGKLKVIEDFVSHNRYLSFAITS